MWKHTSTFGIVNWMFWARNDILRHVPPFELLPGWPSKFTCLRSWSGSSEPGKSGLNVDISVAIVPKAQISIGYEYLPLRSKSSGARYHLVDTYEVYGSGQSAFRAKPKSASLTIYVSESVKKLSSSIHKINGVELEMDGSVDSGLAWLEELWLLA